ncbi:hypothetical protein OESDEN_18576 [Oesophagostomum dentatum]|uniref:Metalloendopeptidase n=1 Tax=Oesophagostomum dentatum TaxID=61180 RepID=A0A0B1SCX3_OESDE|nr:hypothetical protein OESDEN_18576 [Oesophagostomum dentatum]
MKTVSLAVDDKIRVTAEYPGCSSPVGKKGKEQLLMLGRNCQTFRNIAHELGHALGLFHIMQRHDRDDYITVKPKNIMVIFFLRN